MKVVVDSARVSGISDERDHASASNDVMLFQPIGTTLKMRVVKDQLAVSAQFIDRDTAGVRIEKFDDLAISCRKHGRAGRCHDINGVVRSTAGTRLCKRVYQLITSYAFYRDEQLICWRIKDNIWLLRGRRRGRDIFDEL